MFTVTGHFVPRSFLTQVNSYQFGHFVPTFWPFRTNIQNDLKPRSCAQFATRCKFACTREQIYTRVQICTPLCRVHMPINCVHTHLDLIRNLIQVTHFRRNSLCLNVLNDSNCFISVYVLGERGGGLHDISSTECVVETFTLHSYKSQVRKALLFIT